MPPPVNCPYCRRAIHAFSGLQEAQKFQRHLRTCRKNPANLALSWGRKTVITPSNPSLRDALKLRHDSGQ